ncbi:hypothetical protein C8R44DRAFT_729616 [Mycena epipterygia]|nr:hypothetical protein C8R44DRAFT_729616 [Mycena epipterygia]
MDPSKPTIFYDIPLVATVPTYTVLGQYLENTWVDLPDIKKLGVAPAEKLKEGSPLCTLPMIQELSTGQLVGDSFDNTAESSKATYCAREGKEEWEDFTVVGQEREHTLEAFKAALGEMAKRETVSRELQ